MLWINPNSFRKTVKIAALHDYLPAQAECFDLIVVVLGPEPRAVNIVQKYRPEAALKICLVGQSRDTSLAFESNKLLLTSSGYAEMTETALSSDFLTVALKNDNSRTLNVLFDVSCLSRPGMAETLLAVLDVPNFSFFNITFAYSIAAFTTPLATPVLNEAIEPVHPRFSGWPSTQANPTSLITGLGYEPEKAEGASEYLDPAEQWGFIPVSQVQQFLPELMKNNERLIRRLEKGNKAIKYDLHRPARTFGQLEMIISDLIRRTNPILLPFGPKIFFELCLVQGICHPEVGVWHVTSEINEEPVDRHASGVEVGFRVTFQAE